MAVNKTGLTREDLGYIEHGSDAHRALLGIDREKDPEARAKLEEALNATPPKVVSKTKPITRENFRPRTRRNDGDVIIDGWRRVGR
ncbi:hypothetical protein KKH23_06630 [Patescibacteria group bacterium]|nr:hypothetical protein [Patescibacteria group bacterium]